MIQTCMYQSGTVSNIVSKSQQAIASFLLLGIMITDPRGYAVVGLTFKATVSPEQVEEKDMLLFRSLSLPHHKWKEKFCGELHNSKGPV